ncbi:MAG TPA: hypothetical protein VHV31_06140 [Nitrolancea sp.]|nr:hypothetical protein [Nitrolancea sp.]
MNIRVTGAIRDEQDKTVAIADEYVQELGTNLKERLDGQRVEDVVTVIRELADAADKRFGGQTGEGAYEFHQLLQLAEQNPTGVLHVM